MLQQSLKGILPTFDKGGSGRLERLNVRGLQRPQVPCVDGARKPYRLAELAKALRTCVALQRDLSDRFALKPNVDNRLTGMARFRVNGAQQPPKTGRCLRSKSASLK